MKLVLLLISLGFSIAGAIMVVPPTLHIIWYGDDYGRFKEALKTVVKGGCLALISVALFFIGDTL